MSKWVFYIVGCGIIAATAASVITHGHGIGAQISAISGLMCIGFGSILHKMEGRNE